MKEDSMRFTVIIPTRERADTLRHTLMTCITQEYENLEIIVSDNASLDDTRKVVETCDDSRVRYVNPGKRVSMSSNWEFALSHATGNYVHVLGDDDGLIPGAVKDVAGILQSHRSPAIVWRKAEYAWPSHRDCPNYLDIPLCATIFEMNSQQILRYLERGWLTYPRTPVIYNGFVSRESLERLRGPNGRIIQSATPDVYTGFALLSVIDSYLYCTRPLSVNGASHHSNGASSRVFDNQSVQRLFFSEMDIEQHPMMSIIPGSLTSAVTEAMLQANDHCFGGNLKVDMMAVIGKVVKELNQKGEETYSAGIATLRNLYQGTDLLAWVEENAKRSPAPSFQKPACAMRLAAKLKTHEVINLAPLGIENVNDCCRYVGRLLEDVAPEMPIRRFSWYVLIITWLQRRTGYFRKLPSLC